MVDDDEAVRYAVCLALSVIGCVTESASGAGEALERFRPGRYRAVVTDVTMPVMNGLELARRLRALEPGLPIMIFSGACSVDEIEGAIARALGLSLREAFPEWHVEHPRPGDR